MKHCIFVIFYAIKRLFFSVLCKHRYACKRCKHYDASTGKCAHNGEYPCVVRQVTTETMASPHHYTIKDFKPSDFEAKEVQHDK